MKDLLDDFSVSSNNYFDVDDELVVGSMTITGFESGNSSATTDSNGDLTISHSQDTASINVTASATGTTFYTVQAHTKTTTNFKLRFFDSSGSAVTNTAVTVDYNIRK